MTSAIFIAVVNMPKFNQPESLDFSCLAKWPEWRDRFELYRKATKLDKEDGVIQVTSLVYAMGREANKIFKSFTFAALTKTDPRDPKDDYDTVITKFESYFIPKRNIIQERTKFHQRNQAFGELIENFLLSLHELARYCDFDDKEDENIRD